MMTNVQAKISIYLFLFICICPYINHGLVQLVATEGYSFVSNCIMEKGKIGQQESLENFWSYIDQGGCKIHQRL